MFNRIVRENVDTVRSAIVRKPSPTKAVRQSPAKARSPAATWAASELRSRNINVKPYMSDLAQEAAIKSISTSREMVDFINDGGAYGTERYSETQLENAFRTSHYLYAAMKKVARLVSTVPVVGEGRIRKSTWMRIPETHPLNLMTSNSGKRLWYESYLFYAMFAGLATYKERTPRAVAMDARNTPIYSFSEGAVAGLHVIPNANWQLDEQGYQGEIKGIMLNTVDPDEYGSTYLARQRFIYTHDWDARDPNRGISVVSMAINSAVTNAAIQRFAAHYFMSGAMPMLLVQPDSGTLDEVTPSDLQKQKNRFENIWRGLYSIFSLRSMFVDRRYKIDQVGIKAEEVSAPELNNETLKAICSVVGIAPDLIIPPDGGSDNARHKSLMKQVLTDTVLPFMHDLLSSYNEDLELNDAGLRLVVAEDQMPGLEADRADIATTETGLWTNSLQTLKESRTRINLPEEIKDEEILLVGGKPVTYARLRRDANSVSSEMMQYLVQAWDSNGLRLSEFRAALGQPPTFEGMKDGLKYQVIPDPGAGGGGGGFGGFHGGGGGAPSLPSGDDSGGDVAEKSLDEGDWDEYEEDDDYLPTWAELAEIEDWLAEEGETVDANDMETEPEAVAENDELVVFEPPNSGDVDFTNPATVTTSTAVTMELPVEEVTLGYEVKPTDAQPAPITEAPAGYVYLSLANEDQLVRLQERLKAECPTVELSDPNTLHITLAYAKSVDDSAFNAACALTPDAPRAFSVRIIGLTSFAPYDGGKTPVVLEVELDMKLSGLQSQVRTALEAQGVGLSEYTATGWNPHISLGYLPAPVTLPTWDVVLGVTPQSVCWARDDYKVVHQLPMGQAISADNESPEMVTELQDMTEMFREKFIDLLRLWQRNGEAPRVLPERIRTWVGEALEGRDKHAVFVSALRCAQDGAFDEQATNAENPVIQRLVKGSMQDTSDDELKAWENSARKNYKKAMARFETKMLPVPIASAVRAVLQNESAYNETVKQAFTDARSALATYAPPKADDETLSEWAASILEDDELRALIEGDEGDGADTATT